jgi:hypothetical protein
MAGAAAEKSRGQAGCQRACLDCACGPGLWSGRGVLGHRGRPPAHAPTMSMNAASSSSLPYSSNFLATCRRIACTAGEEGGRGRHGEGRLRGQGAGGGVQAGGQVARGESAPAILACGNPNAHTAFVGGCAEAPRPGQPASAAHHGLHYVDLAVALIDEARQLPKGAGRMDGRCHARRAAVGGWAVRRGGAPVCAAAMAGPQVKPQAKRRGSGKLPQAMQLDVQPRRCFRLGHGMGPMGGS